METELAAEKRENARKGEIIESLRTQLTEIKKLQVSGTFKHTAVSMVVVGVQLCNTTCDSA